MHVHPAVDCDPVHDLQCNDNECCCNRLLHAAISKQGEGGRERRDRAALPVGKQGREGLDLVAFGKEWLLQPCACSPRVAGLPNRTYLGWEGQGVAVQAERAQRGQAAQLARQHAQVIVVQAQLLEGRVQRACSIRQHGRHMQRRAAGLGSSLRRQGFVRRRTPTPTTNTVHKMFK